MPEKVDKTRTIKLGSGAVYKVSWDDGCIKLEGGVTHLEPQLLPLLIDYVWEQKLWDFQSLLEGRQEERQEEKEALTN